MTSASKSGVVKVWLLNLLGGALLIAAGYFWLQIPDARGWQVAGSILLLVLLAFIAAWLRAGAMAYFRIGGYRVHGTVWQAYRRGFRHVVAVIIAVAIFAGAAWWLWSLRAYTPQAGVWIRQKLNAGPTPASVTRDLDWLVAFVVFVGMPAIWLPVTITLAAFGAKFDRILRGLHLLRRPRYWLSLIILVCLGAYIPYRLVWWVPNFETIRSQAWSAGLRFVVAYLIVVSAWVVLLWIAGRGVEQEDIGGM